MYDSYVPLAAKSLALAGASSPAAQVLSLFDTGAFVGSEMDASADSALDPLASAPARFSAVSVNATSISSKVWGDLSFQAVTGNGKAEVFYFSIDIMAYVPKVTLVATEDGRWALRREGCGFRIGAAAWSTEVKLTADIKAVAAVANAKNVGSVVYKDLLGVKHPRLEETKLMSSRNLKIDADFLAMMGEASEEMAAFIAAADNDKYLNPTEVALSIVGAPQYNPVNLAYSRIIGTHGVDNYRTLSEQLELGMTKWSDKMIPAVVRDVYRRCYGVRDNDKPTDEQKDVAKHIIMKGSR